MSVYLPVDGVIFAILDLERLLRNKSNQWIMQLNPLLTICSDVEIDAREGAQAPIESAPSRRTRGTNRGFTFGSGLSFKTDGSRMETEDWFSGLLVPSLTPLIGKEFSNSLRVPFPGVPRKAPARRRRSGNSKMALMVLALLMLSDATSEVSMVPGGCESRRWYGKLSLVSSPPTIALGRRSIGCR